ncbi:MAG: hypothetical protein WDN06_02260 [Asticcacaulis sp.]
MTAVAAVATDDGGKAEHGRMPFIWQTLAFLVALLVMAVDATPIWEYTTNKVGFGNVGLYTDTCAARSFLRRLCPNSFVTDGNGRYRRGRRRSVSTDRLMRSETFVRAKPSA